jgi:hypothetical protein
MPSFGRMLQQHLQRIPWGVGDRAQPMPQAVALIRLFLPRKSSVALPRRLERFNYLATK